MRLFRLSALLFLLVPVCFAQASKEAAAPPSATKPHSFDLDAIDRTVDPCVDFYQYACGNWMKQNPIPPEYPSWDTFSELRARNQQVLREILEKAAVPDPKRSAVDQKIGDYYASCMDEKAVDAAGDRPIRPELRRIAAIKDRKQLATELVRLHLDGNNALFGFGSTIDYKDASRQIAE